MFIEYQSISLIMLVQKESNYSHHYEILAIYEHNTETIQILENNTFLTNKLVEYLEDAIKYHYNEKIKIPFIIFVIYTQNH